MIAERYLSPSFVLPIEGTLLLALFAGLWRAILLLRVGAALTFGPNECGNDVTVLTWLRLEEREYVNSYICSHSYNIHIVHWAHKLTVPNCFTFCAHFLQIVLVLLEEK